MSNSISATTQKPHIPHVVYLQVGACNLLVPRKDKLRRAPNALLVVSQKEVTESGSHWQYLYRSEMLGDTNQPTFDTPLLVRPEGREVLELKLDVYDADTLTHRSSEVPDESRLLGSALFKGLTLDMMSGRRLECPLEYRSDSNWDREMRENNCFVWLRQSSSARAVDPKAVPLQRLKGPLSFIVGARDLLKLHDFSASDPLVAVFFRDPHTQEWSLIGRTETSVNNHDPRFKKVFTAPGPAEIKLDVYAADPTREIAVALDSLPAENRLIGSSIISLSDALASPDQEAEVFLSNRANPVRHTDLGKARSRCYLKLVAGAEGYDVPADNIDLVLGARNLLNINFLYKCDPLAALYVRLPTDQEWRYQGRTELIPNHHNPNFRKYFRLSGKTDPQAELRVDVYDGDTMRNAGPETPLPDAAALIGSATYRLDELLHTVGEHLQHNMWHSDRYKDAALHEAGASVAVKAIDRRTHVNTIQFSVGATQMVRLPGYDKCDPMIVLYKRELGASTWTYMDRTECLRDALNPSFHTPLTLTVSHDGDPTVMFCVYHGSSFFDLDKNSTEPPREGLIGSSTVRLGQLMKDSMTEHRHDQGPYRKRASLQLVNHHSREMDRALNMRGSSLWVCSSTAAVGMHPHEFKSLLRELLFELTSPKPTGNAGAGALIRLLDRILESADAAFKANIAGRDAVRPVQWVSNILQQSVEEVSATRSNGRPSLEQEHEVRKIARMLQAAASRASREELTIASLLTDVADLLNRKNSPFVTSVPNAAYEASTVHQARPWSATRPMPVTTAGLMAGMHIDPAATTQSLASTGLADRQERAHALARHLDELRILNPQFQTEYRKGDSVIDADPLIRRDRSKADVVTYRMKVALGRLPEYSRNGSASVAVFLFKKDRLSGRWLYTSRTEIGRGQGDLSFEFRDQLLVDVDKTLDVNPLFKFSVYNTVDYEAIISTVPPRARLLATVKVHLSDLVDQGPTRRNLVHDDDPEANRILLRTGSQLIVCQTALLTPPPIAFTSSFNVPLQLRVGLRQLPSSRIVSGQTLVLAIYRRDKPTDPFQFFVRCDGSVKDGWVAIQDPLSVPYLPEEIVSQEYKVDVHTADPSYEAWSPPSLASGSAASLLGTATFDLRHLHDRKGQACMASLTHPDGAWHADLRASRSVAWAQMDLVGTLSDYLAHAAPTPIASAQLAAQTMSMPLSATSSTSVASPYTASNLTAPLHNPMFSNTGPIMPSLSSLVKLRLRVGARALADDLVRQQGPGFSVVALYQRLASEDKFRYVAQTELRRNTLNPSFEELLHLEYNPRDEPVLMFVVFFQKTRGHNTLDRSVAKSIGSVLMTVRECTEYPDRRIVRQLEKDSDSVLGRHLLEKGSNLWVQCVSEYERIYPRSTSYTNIRYDPDMDDPAVAPCDPGMQRIHMSFSASNVLLTFDPSCVVALYQYDHRSGDWLYEGCTETICESSHPYFSRSLTLTVNASAPMDTEYKVVLYDNMNPRGGLDRSHAPGLPAGLPEDLEYVGSAFFLLADVLPQEAWHGTNGERVMQLTNSKTPGKQARLVEDGTTVTVTTVAIDRQGRPLHRSTRRNYGDRDRCIARQEARFAVSGYNEWDNVPGYSPATRRTLYRREKPCGSIKAGLGAGDCASCGACLLSATHTTRTGRRYRRCAVCEAHSDL